MGARLCAHHRSDLNMDIALKVRITLQLFNVAFRPGNLFIIMASSFSTSDETFS
jgi:hypothetical protein